MAVKLGIVIVHFNTPQDLERCLASLHEHAPVCSWEIAIVDNASRAAGLDQVRARFPGCRWLLNTENLGYARGCNQGLAAIAAEHNLILNPDIVVLPGALDALVAVADAHPHAGIIGPQLLNDDGTIQESCRRFYTFTTLLLRRTPLGRLFPHSQTVARHLMRDFDHRAQRPVDWVLGGCVLVRSEAVARCGPMDERFFLYFEDVDWCTRMWRCGFEVLYTPAARFVHRHRRASAKGPLSRSYWLHLTSLVSFYEKWGLLVYLLKKWRQPLDQLALWALDMVMLVAAFLAAYGLRQVLQPLFPEALFPLAWYRNYLLYVALLVTVAFLLLGRYRAPRVRRPASAGEFARQMGLVGLLLLSGSYLGREQVVSRAALLIFLGLFTLLAGGGERLLNGLRRRMERGYFSLERTLLVGTPEHLAAWLAACPRPRAVGVDAVGYVTPAAAGRGAPGALGQGDIPWLGPALDLPALVERLRVSQVVFWDQPQMGPFAPADLARLRRHRIRLRWRIDEAWLVAARARPETFGGEPSGVLDPDDVVTFSRIIRRVLALVAGLLLALPVAAGSSWRRFRGGGRTEMVDCAAGSAHNFTLTLVCDSDGRLRPLWEQWGLVAALLRGRVFLTGQRLWPTGAGMVPDPGLEFWRADQDQPGLTGPWARGGRGFWGTFWRDPGGLGTMAAIPGEPVAQEEREC